jgi:hypothetical protein
MAEKTLQDEVSEPTLQEKQRAALKLIKMMQTDVMTAMATGVPLVLEGEGPLGALLSVLQVAEKATAEKMVPILGADGKPAGGGGKVVLS